MYLKSITEEKSGNFFTRMRLYERRSDSVLEGRQEVR